jgi:hypothetical protein
MTTRQVMWESGVCVCSQMRQRVCVHTKQEKGVLKRGVVGEGSSFWGREVQRYLAHELHRPTRKPEELCDGRKGLVSC